VAEFGRRKGLKHKFEHLRRNPFVNGV